MPMRVEAEGLGRRSCSQRSEGALSTGIRYRRSNHVDLPSNSSVIRGLERGIYHSFELVPRPATVKSNIIGNHSGAEDASRLSSSTELRSSTLLARTAARIPKPYVSRGQAPRLIW